MECDELVAALDDALDALLAARVEASPIVARPVPTMALDAALAASRPYAQAKAATTEALAHLVVVVDEADRPLVLVVESSLRHEAALVADTAFSIGLTATGRR